MNQFTCPVILFQGLEDKVCDCNRYHTALFGVGENNPCIPPTLEGWVYITPIHGPLDGPLYT